VSLAAALPPAAVLAALAATWAWRAVAALVPGCLGRRAAACHAHEGDRFQLALYQRI
jgi:hypothetical protein